MRLLNKVMASVLTHGPKGTTASSTAGKTTQSTAAGIGRPRGGGTSGKTSAKVRINAAIKDKATKGRLDVPFDARPKSTTASLPGRNSSQTRNLTTSSSAGNVNTKRNIRQHRVNVRPETGLNQAFEKLTVKDKRNSSSAQFHRRSSSAAGSASHVCKSLDDVARWILMKKCQNIVVMAGAGISTPSGIPDFRSPGSGLYDNLQQYNIPFPEAIFDIDFFHRDPRPFFTLAKELYPGTYRPNYVHYFVRMLHDKGLLLRMYTQNIDGLERMAGISSAKLVEAHGTFASSTCTRCDQKYDGEETKVEIMSDKIPRCKQRSCTGKVKPDIVFFGEDLPKRFFYYLKDFAQCDLVIVMGTSLEVQPFAGIINSARGYIPRLLINREAVGPFARPRSSRFNDVTVTGDLVECVQRFARILGWKAALQELIEEHQIRLDEEYGPRKLPATPPSNCSDSINGGESKPTNDKPSTGASSTNNARGGFRGYKANSCQSLDAMKGTPAKTNLPNGSKPRNFHTVSETTSPLNPLGKIHPSPRVERSSKKSVTFPKLNNNISSRGRGKSWRSESSDSSDSSESSSDTDSSDS
ncbi:NAD-dependent protein deacetylase sirtuin-3, mitochondrial-like [Asterias amurensis]|uniref:NAD-dependent protein deacetylase sirtuin-3, mitochondrial-like n=1 Tax=Asterias amurensis TaxID=7602 RepID=UPI003AB22B3E